jgi:regulator of sigma E protease
MAGETFDEDRQGSPDEFLSHPRWHRFLVAVAGPFMNITLAVLILAFSYMEGIRVPRYPSEPAIVGPVAEKSIAYRAGLRPGDQIVSVRGNAVNTWEEMEIALGTSPRNPIEIEVLRNQERVKLRLDPPARESIDPGSLGFSFTIPRTVVGSIEPDSPALKAGLKEGDEILSVNGRPTKRYEEVKDIIAASKGVSLKVEVRRGDQILQLNITPIEKDGVVMIGFRPEIPSDFEKYSLPEAIRHSIRRNYEYSMLTFKIIGRIFKGSASVRTLSGPLEIAQISGRAARTGSAKFFFGLIGMISLQLGVFNLLPIPILDGGVIALLLVEGIMRRDLSMALKEKIVQVGFVFLILLMGFVVINDLTKIVNFDKLFR